MGIFNSLLQKSPNKELVFLGAPEAEAEALPNAQMKLLDVYEDHFNLLEELEHEKFLVLGKKGSGKSAFAEYVVLKAKDEPNLFAKFIRQNECNLEHIVQIGNENGHKIEREQLFTWLILTNIIELFLEKENESSKEFTLLEQFIKKNSGYINIDESQIKQLVEEKGFEVDVTYLKRFFTNKLKKKTSETKERAPFFKLIPDLKDTIKILLTKKTEIENDNSYVIFFDDLDLVYNSNDEGSNESILSLIRVAKGLNKEFAEIGSNAKIIIVLRDDIYKTISPNAADSGKVLGSYGIYINWYQDEYNINNSEQELYIRKFINKRISIAFDEIGKSYNKDDPWISLVEEPFKSGAESSNSSFKYVLLHTLMRPRDLLNFFQPLSKAKYSYPLDKSDINKLIKIYSEEFVTELRNELSNFYELEVINYIFKFIGEVSRKNEPNTTVTYEKAIDLIKEHGIAQDNNADKILNDLFERSIIGKISENNYTYFKHREPKKDVYELSKSDKIIVHNILKVYCDNRGF
ncbi:P-loop ATPase, Sll1717 family [Actinobacillus equuli]|uniref:P-loop ATPase, Sll1717 family n=1 Tax=Actinobacillus equuli TaxID=718 RepID=UPI002441BD7C|nr:hypothetical protein [Actinobacillus equuli]WGE46211.1 hypothetical protein NYR84_08945 [Actinobacillus equuli subsp. haemolyticus]